MLSLQLFVTTHLDDRIMLLDTEYSSVPLRNIRLGNRGYGKHLASHIRTARGVVRRVICCRPAHSALAWISVADTKRTAPRNTKRLTAFAGTDANTT